MSDKDEHYAALEAMNEKHRKNWCEAMSELSKLKIAYGCHVQADAYRDTFPDNEEDAKYLRKQETWWRLTARAKAGEALESECADAAKSSAQSIAKMDGIGV